MIVKLKIVGFLNKNFKIAKKVILFLSIFVFSQVVTATDSLNKDEKLLLNSVLNGNADKMLECLGKEGVNPNVCDVYGRTAFSLAVRKNKVNVLKVLLGDSRIDPNKADCYGNTPTIWLGNET